MTYTPKRGVIALVAFAAAIAAVRFAEAQFVAPTCVPPACNPSVIQNIPLGGTSQSASFNVTGDGKVGNRLIGDQVESQKKIQVGTDAPNFASAADVLIYGNVSGGVAGSALMVLRASGTDRLRIGVEGNGTLNGDLDVQGGDVKNTTGGLNLSSFGNQNVTITANAGGQVILDSGNGTVQLGAGDSLNVPGGLAVGGTLNASGFSGNGSGLTNLNATNITSGTLAAARLPSNVALRDAVNNFTTTNTFAGNVGVGTVSPSAQMHLQSGAAVGLIGAASQLILQSETSHGLQFTACDACGHYIDFGNTTGSAQGFIRFNDAVANGFTMGTAGDLDAFVILPDGRIGINTTAPGAGVKVQINAPASTEGIRIVSAADWSPINVRNSANTADIFRVDQTGSLAVGSVPWARLSGFPAACPAGQYASAVGGTLTCSAPVFTDTFQTVTDRGNSTTRTIGVGGAGANANYGVNVNGNITGVNANAVNYGVYAVASDIGGVGVVGSGPNTGVYGTSTNIGVYGSGSTGVYGVGGAGGDGVAGYNGSGSNGVHGYAPNGTGGYFDGGAGGIGAYGQSSSAQGVSGFSGTGYGVQGASSSGRGGSFSGGTGTGIYAEGATQAIDECDRQPQCHRERHVRTERHCWRTKRLPTGRHELSAGRRERRRHGELRLEIHRRDDAGQLADFRRRIEDRHRHGLTPRHLQHRQHPEPDRCRQHHR